VAYATREEIVKEWSAVTGAKATAVMADDEKWKAGLRSFGMSEEAAEELLQNMQLMDRFGYYGGEGLEESQKVLGEPLTTWKGYVAKQDKWKIL
jgi:hypothetical protein